MKLFYCKFILIITLLFSCSAFATPIINMTASPDPAVQGGTVIFDLSFSEPVGSFSDHFFGMTLEVVYDSTYLMPQYGLGFLESCIGTNCGSTSIEFYDDDLAFYDSGASDMAVLDIYPLFLPLDYIMDIGFITFDVIGNESTDVDTLVTANGFYDTLSLISEPISGEGSVTIKGSSVPVPAPGILPLMLIGLASLFSTAIIRRKGTV